MKRKRVSKTVRKKKKLIYEVKNVSKSLLNEIIEKGKIPIEKFQKDIPDDIFKEILDFMMNEKKWIYVENGFVIRGKEEPIGFDFYDGESFMKLKLPEPKFQLESIILEKSITILAGYQSCFKTHLASLLALCLTNGKKLFDRFYCKKSKVWYINEELHTGVFQKLLRQLAKGLGVNVNKDLFVTNFQNLKIDKCGDNKKYLKFIKKNKIEFVIFDTFRECFLAPENSADEITKVLADYVRPIIESTNCSFLIIMHKGKAGVGTESRQPADLIRGSSVFRNYVDSILLVDRIRKTGRIEVTHEKIRATKELEKFQVNWEFDNDSILARFMSEEEVESLLIDDCKHEMMAYFKKEDIEKFESVPLFEKKLKKNYSRGTFYSAMDELIKEGKIRRIKRGKYEVVGRRLNDI